MRLSLQFRHPRRDFLCGLRLRLAVAVGMVYIRERGKRRNGRGWSVGGKMAVIKGGHLKYETRLELARLSTKRG
jgi:hypothetical protein